MTPNEIPGGAGSAPRRVAVREEPPAVLAAEEGYGCVPIAFTVREVLDCTPARGGLGGLALAPRALDQPYVKDYDALDGGPARWVARFGTAAVARWGVFAAYEPYRPHAPAGGRVGGAVVVPGGAPADWSPDGRPDLALLWDLRVAPDARGHGVGAALFGASAAWARARGARRLVAETQNVNVAACRFYARLGGVLGAVDRFAYPSLPGEVRLLWYFDL